MRTMIKSSFSRFTLIVGLSLVQCASQQALPSTQVVAANNETPDASVTIPDAQQSSIVATQQTGSQCNTTRTLAEIAGTEWMTPQRAEEILATLPEEQKETL